MTVQVFRVEHATKGCGPYTGEYNQRQWAWETHDWSNGRPSPLDDGLSYFPGSYAFGLPSLDSLMEWFSHAERKALARLGFVLSVYNVPDDKVQNGTIQVVFSKEDSELELTMPL